MNGAARDRILLANDGSEQSLQTVRYVSSILDLNRFELVMFHVVTKFPESFIDIEKGIPAYRYKLVNVEPWEKQQQKAVREYMEKAEAIVMDAGCPNVAITIKIEDRKIGIAQDIAAESRNGYKALVVGRRGLSDFKDFMLGSVAQHILGIVPIPMWIAAGDSRPIRALACLDGSEGSMLALTHLADVLDTSKNFEITLFHATHSFHGFRNFVREAFSSEKDKTVIEQIHRELDRGAEALEPSFDKARATLISRGINPARVHQKIARGAGSPAHAIVEEGEKGKYDTILVGRRGLSKVEEFIMGRVSNKVIHMAKDKTVWVVC